MQHADQRRWASKTSWRLTFTVWTIVLALWAVLTVVIDKPTLLVIRRVIGEHGARPIMVLAVVVVTPMLVDALRNALRHRHRAAFTAGRRGRVWRRADADSETWESAVPAATPRHFRAQADTPDITWRERAIVEQGQLAHGTVQHHGALSSVRYDAPWGEAIGSRPVIAVEPRPREGVRAPLLFEPGASVGVAPTLLGLELRKPDAFDARGELEPTKVTNDVRDFSTVLRATLHPVEHMSRYCTMDVGELALMDGCLTLTPAKGVPVAVRLDKPFRVRLSTHLLPGGRAELNIALEQRTTTAYRAGDPAPLQVKTELTQRRVGSHLDEDWVDACYIDSESFERLWVALVTLADDTSLTRSVAANAAAPPL